MSKKLILFTSVLALGVFFSLAIPVAGRFSRPEEGLFSEEGDSFDFSDALPRDNPMRERLTEIFDSWDTEDERSREGFAERLNQFSGQFLRDREDFGELRRIIRLIVTLLTDRDPRSREEAAVILGNSNRRIVVGPLIAALLHDRSQPVRQKAATSLGNLGSLAAPAIPILIHAVKKDEEQYVQRASVQALGLIETRHPKKWQIDFLIDVLDKYTGENHSYPKRWWSHRWPKRAKKKTYEVPVRSNAALSLGRLGATEAVPALLRALSDSDQMVQLASLYALALIRDPDSIEPLEEMLIEEEDPRARFALKWTIEEIKVDTNGNSTY
jgi:hypothetical protein